MALKGEDEEQLWRLFYRRSGMPRLEFSQLMARGRWLRVPAGSKLVDNLRWHEALHVLVEGRCTFCTGGHSTSCRCALKLSACRCPAPQRVQAAAAAAAAASGRRPPLPC